MIQNATTIGLSTGKIRLKFGLTCSKDKLYGIRRPILGNERDEEMKKLIVEMNKWDNWKNTHTYTC